MHWVHTSDITAYVLFLQVSGRNTGMPGPNGMQLGCAVTYRQ